MSDWTPVGNIDAGIATPEPAIGDLWLDRKLLKHPELGAAWVTDTLPFTPKDEAPKPVERVCVQRYEKSRGEYREHREWMSVGELRKRFTFSRRS